MSQTYMTTAPQQYSYNPGGAPVEYFQANHEPIQESSGWSWKATILTGGGALAAVFALAIIAHQAGIHKAVQHAAEIHCGDKGAECVAEFSKKAFETMPYSNTGLEGYAYDLVDKVSNAWSTVSGISSTAVFIGELVGIVWVGKQVAPVAVPAAKIGVAGAVKSASWGWKGLTYVGNGIKFAFGPLFKRYTLGH